MIHSFLLIGQSNMAGRGFAHEVERIRNKDVLVLRNGRWLPMYVPVNPDRSFAGVNLAESFADKYAREKQVQVGLIPCADGGTCLDQWVEGGLLFDHACYMAKLATRTSTIAGVLWHQGESDCMEHRYPFYEMKCAAIMEAFRRELDLYDVPFLLGGLGDYLMDCDQSPVYQNYRYINEALRQLAGKQCMMGYVSAEGLTANADNLHFNAASLREFGLRYYEEFLKLEDKYKVFEEKSTPDQAIRNEIELL